MMTRFISVIFFLFILTPCTLKCQEIDLFSNLKSPVKRADKLFDEYAFASAIDLYKQVLKQDSSNDLVKLKIAESFRMLNQTKEAEKWYAKVIGNNSVIKPIHKFYYAQALVSNGKYEEGRKWFEEYKKMAKDDQVAGNMVEGLKNISMYYEDSLTYPVKEVKINSSHADFSPVYYDEGILFVSARTRNVFVKALNTWDNSTFLDFYYSKINKEGVTQNAVKLKGPINSPLHEGPATIYNEGKSIIFTRNAVTKFNINSKESKEGVNRLMLFSASRNEKDQWEDIKPLPFNNFEYSIGHPSIASDGNKLYFASNKPGGFGGTDLYVSTYIDSVWSEPKNLGPQINTSGNEVFPYVYQDSVLYFSSNGYGGLGGLDIYSIKIKDDSFSKLKNLGYPINSSLDDFGIIISADGRSGFFSSNRKKGGNDDNLYQFEVIQVPVYGTVVTKLKDQPVKNTVIRVLYNDEEVATTKTDVAGKFFLNLQPGKKYSIIANKEEFKQIKQELSTKNYKEEKYNLSFSIEAINKAYVKGIVKFDSSEYVKNPFVTYLDKQTGERHTIEGNDEGDFQCEIDSDNEFVFFSKSENKAGVAILKSTKKKRGSVVFNVDIKLTDYFIHTIKGVVKDSSGMLNIGEVRIEDIISGEVQHLTTDSLGIFSFDAKSYAVYNITVRNGNKVGVMNNFSTETYAEPVIKITLFKEEE